MCWTCFNEPCCSRCAKHITIHTEHLSNRAYASSLIVYDMTCINSTNGMWGSCPGFTVSNKSWYLTEYIWGRDIAPANDMYICKECIYDHAVRTMN